MNALKALVESNLDLFHEMEAMDTQLRFQLRLEGKELGLPFASSSVFNKYEQDLIVILTSYQNGERSLKECVEPTATLMNHYYRTDQ
jgi:hypothetical protein